LPHIDSAYRLARGLAGNPADADDIVQDACMRAFKGIDGYAGGHDRAWVLTITRNATFTFMARNRPKQMVLPSDEDEQERLINSAPDPSESPEESLISRMSLEALDAAIKSLSPPYREIIVLREYNDLSYKEISGITGLPIGTVMSRLARARSMLLRVFSHTELHRASS